VLILGIDSGSQVLGYGLIRAEGDMISYRASGVLTATGTKYERLAELSRDLEALLIELKPNVVALEAGFVGKVRGHLEQTTLVSAAARGVAGTMAARAGIEVVEYMPATAKKAVTGKGNADKALVSRCVKLCLFMHKEPPPDAGDALSVAICHAQALVAVRRMARAAG